MSKENSSKSEVAAVAPVSTPAPAVAAVVQPPPAPSGRPGCGYTLLIVVITIICTLIAEAFLVFGVLAYVGTKVSQSLKDFSSSSASTKTADGKPKTLSPDQTTLIKSMGIDPKDLPPEIPPEKVACAIEAIGEDRLKAIIASKETPGLGDIFKLRACL